MSIAKDVSTWIVSSFGVSPVRRMAQKSASSSCPDDALSLQRCTITLTGGGYSKLLEFIGADHGSRRA